MIVHFSLLIHKNFRAFAFYPFIFIKNKEEITDKTLINHEKIHLKQQIELLIIFFFISYFLEFIWNYFRFKSFMMAYRNISFEKEAYQNDANLNYLKTRKRYSFLKYHQ
ncbi:MAG: hypothetical protein NDI80_09910 [Flavobacteriaceae bacterium]|nr:hypothetical protein [Flavobacteriaceae bacterium]